LALIIFLSSLCFQRQFFFVLIWVQAIYVIYYYLQKNIIFHSVMTLFTLKDFKKKSVTFFTIFQTFLSLLNLKNIFQTIKSFSLLKIETLYTWWWYKCNSWWRNNVLFEKDSYRAGFNLFWAPVLMSNFFINSKKFLSLFHQFWASKALRPLSCSVYR
jgi:hypothetical protein